MAEVDLLLDEIIFGWGARNIFVNENSFGLS